MPKPSKSARYTLAPNGIFLTIQGEGALIGEPMVFVRLAGCSVGCSQCDTDYSVFESLDAATIANRVESHLSAWVKWVWITGGEPADRDLVPLIKALRKIPSLRIAIATSGHKPFPTRGALDYDWLSVSPHKLRWSQNTGQELKIVLGLNGLTVGDVITTLDERIQCFGHYFLQPMYGCKESLEESLRLMRLQPGKWKLTVQAHKQWGLA